MGGVESTGRNRVAVIGAGISGLSCAWLLSKSCDVTLYEAEHRLGGHSDTVDWQGVGVDNGFIVYNERTYPNLTALLHHLEVPTLDSEMSFAVSVNKGAFEYSGGDLRGMVAQPSNLMRPTFWALVFEIIRFFRQAKQDADAEVSGTLSAYLDHHRFSQTFRSHYLYPMAAAIWSTAAAEIGAYPAEAFLRFNRNHGLLDLFDRPIWRTVAGGSRSYVQRIHETFNGKVITGRKVLSVSRSAHAAFVVDEAGQQSFDHVVIAAHADEALRMVQNPTVAEQALLGIFRYSDNDVVMHTDIGLMPRRRAAWSSWNYLTDHTDDQARLSVSYWMNRLQALDHLPPVFVTLNPLRDIDPAQIVRHKQFRHPLFTEQTLAAQKQLWSLQGQGGLWFCGAWFGAGFHEDGLQAGLAVAEAIGGVKRPWQVENESGRIYVYDRLAESESEKKVEVAA